MSEKKSFRSGLLCGLLLAVLMIGSIFIGSQVYARIEYENTKQANAEVRDPVVNASTNNKMQVIKDTIEEYYLEEVDEDALTDGIYAGMVASLGDPYSAYYSQEDLEELRQQTAGIYYGIGAYIGKDTNTGLPMITGTIEGTPAEASGLQYGDLICAVDDQPVEGMENSEVVLLIKGEEGTTVKVTVYREGEADYLDFDIKRKKIESPTVEQEMFPGGIGYIRIMEFDDVTVDQFTEALAVCKGSDMKGLILDLRNNPGGNVSAVTEIARQILPKGLIVYTEDKAGERVEYSCDGRQELNVPLVVLVNGGSASASEILAGAIKDHEKGILLGATTFGKGIVQRIVPLTDGSALKLTVSSYFTPNGNNIHKVGIEPNEELKFDADKYLKDGTDNQLERAKEILRSGK
ncbi:MAG: S41 family peptidase [Clostridiales bacterium]|nr:S41 family peptidase [Clostridiales bacterium]